MCIAGERIEWTGQCRNEKEMAWQCQVVDVSVSLYFLVKQVFLILLLSQAGQGITLAVFERLRPACSSNFIDHLLYVILHFSLVCLLYTLKLFVFPIW